MIINFLLFQLGWFACVLGGAYDQALLGSLIALAIIAYHCYRAPDAVKEGRLLLLALIIGLIFESIITSQGIARYSTWPGTRFHGTAVDDLDVAIVRDHP